jgi:cell division septal protein FtsQ
MKNNIKKIIKYLKKYFSRFLIFEYIVSCILVVFIFSSIRPRILLISYEFLCKYIGKIPGHDYIYNIIISIVCLVLFGLITYILTDMCLEIKKYFKVKGNENKKEFDELYKKYRETKSYIIWLHDLEYLAKKTNLYNKVPENL